MNAGSMTTRPDLLGRREREHLAYDPVSSCQDAQSITDTLNGHPEREVLENAAAYRAVRRLLSTSLWALVTTDLQRRSGGSARSRLLVRW
jgi:hypothetical protein